MHAGDYRHQLPPKGRTITENPTRHRRAAAAILAAAFCLLAARASAADELYAPKLVINIPTIRFSTVPVESTNGAAGSGYIDVPWIAEYMKGTYSYAVSIAGLLAAVMVVSGGFIYLTAGGDATRVKKGRQRIADAVIGLFLVYGAYVILQTINHDLISNPAVHVRTVNRIQFSVDTTLGDTPVATAGDAPGDQNAGTSGPTPGSHTPSTASCPFALTSTAGRAGRMAFADALRTNNSVTATAPRDRILRVADIADACNVNLGSCGRTAGTIYALAGAGRRASCLTPPDRDDDCNGNFGRETKAVSRTQRAHMAGLRCLEPGQLYHVGRTDVPPQNPCEGTSGSAQLNVLHYLQQQRDAGDRTLAGWPDSWADTLQPGDYVVVYNGNSDFMGSHAVIFVGWASDGKSMQVVQGGNGGRGAERNVTRPGSICVKSSCGERQVPLTYIRTP